MSDFSGYPPVLCKDCGNSDTVVIRPADQFRQFGPGEHAIYQCQDCWQLFDAIVPEPPDKYEGDGVFAENH